MPHLTTQSLFLFLYSRITSGVSNSSHPCARQESSHDILCSLYWLIYALLVLFLWRTLTHYQSSFCTFGKRNIYNTNALFKYSYLGTREITQRVGMHTLHVWNPAFGTNTRSIPLLGPETTKVALVQAIMPSQAIPHFWVNAPITGTYWIVQTKRGTWAPEYY